MEFMCLKHRISCNVPGRHLAPMRWPQKLSLAIFLTGLVLVLPWAVQSQPLEVKVDPVRENDVIPIKLSGFSGEVLSVLEFDLSVVGFRISPSGAVFELSSSADGEFGGQLMDLYGNGKRIFGKKYAGSDPRDQAHALADDVVMAIRGIPGIGRTKILFRCESPVGSRKYEIFMSDFDGHRPRQLTHDKTVVRDPAWHAPSGMVYYVSYLKGNPDIVLHNLRSGQRSAIANFGGTNSGPAVSPDGSRLAMILTRDGNQELYTALGQGGGFQRLTRTSQLEVSPCWAPTGDRICFSSEQAGGRPLLYTINSDGSGMQSLKISGANHATEPSWSPDGKSIAFTQTLGNNFSVYVVPSSGGNCQSIIQGEDPHWSPNSRTLVFSRRIGDKRVLSVLDVPTKQVKDLPLSSLGNCTQPAWGN